MSAQEKSLFKSFPLDLKTDVETVFNYIKTKTDDALVSYCFKVKVNDEDIEIPYRIYFNEPPLDLDNVFTPVQRLIYYCIFTRHHNGYIREKNLIQLLKSEIKQIWVMPYILRLIGEYVIEIFKVIEDLNYLINREIMSQFIEENPEFYELTKNRVISYWNVYYRKHFPNLEDYVGYQLVMKLGKFTCPCCGYKTLMEEHGWETCPICFWEDDQVQYDDPYYVGGANTYSLIQAQINYKRFGAYDYGNLNFVKELNEDDVKDSKWHPYLRLNPHHWMYLSKLMGDTFIKELKKELSKKHSLFGIDIEAIAKRQDCDDVLFMMKDGSHRFAVVHLTWSGHVENNPILPETRIYTNVDDINIKENS